MLATLPQRLDRIEIPHFFHPSSFVALEQCALSVLGIAAAERPEDLLIRHPTAYLGILLHHVRAEVRGCRWGNASSASTAVDAIFEEALQHLEQSLMDDATTRTLVPLHEVVGRRKWKRRIHELRTWASTLDIKGSGEPPRPFSGSDETSEAYGVETSPGTGIEKTIAVDHLRLRGRPDASIETNDTIHIVEYKTGRLRDPEGKILEAHRVQVQLYGLMFESVGDKAVRLSLEQVERHSILWSMTERDALIERLQEIRGALPSGEVRDAESLANPGTHCCRCRLRPVCGAYLDQAPKWWRGGEHHPRPLPLDVWGEVTQPVAGDDLLTLRLSDRAGRRVRVGQVSQDKCIAGLAPHDSVWMFDLEASEDLRSHGELRHPRNFHEHPPGPRWRRARRLRVFGPRLSPETP